MTWDVHPVRPAELQTALGLLFKHLPAEEQTQQVGNLLRQIAVGELAIAGLWGAWNGPQLCGVFLSVSQADGGVSLWPPVLDPALWDNPEHVWSIARELLRTGIQHWQTAGVRIAQCLIEHGDEISPLIMEHSGFVRMAEIIFFECTQPQIVEDDARFPTPKVTPRTVEFTEAERSQFEELLVLSYQNSLDCPALTQRRTAAEALHSHQLAGPFRPELWRRYETLAGDPLGVLLLTQNTPAHPLELIYCGLATAHRGQGWGRWLVAETLRTACRLQARKVIVSADVANTPACELYRRCGFVEVDRKLVEMWFSPGASAR